MDTLNSVGNSLVSPITEKKLDFCYRLNDNKYRARNGLDKMALGDDSSKLPAHERK